MYRYFFNSTNTCIIDSLTKLDFYMGYQLSRTNKISHLILSTEVSYVKMERNIFI